eukprot:gnl/TRDRNA2_/TRDRNA2_73437_c0_seq1.p1 gnl/TRDRNA2_/TRDRNA2_73437_c0~~gnl/TRDRNA2_/TRDRNA2_73437_c0_seq1.p1  ORF type:complete len:282 (-),score=42.32 gnl/TRDRNA2_/TRDRNA2_73437_c0_seq1:47-892(-)
MLEDLGLSLYRVLCFLSPDNWFHMAVAHQGLLKLGDQEVNHLIETAGWLRDLGAPGGPPELAEAARNGLLHIVFARLRCLGEDPNVRESKHPKYTPLHRGVTGGHQRIVRLLLSARANASSRDRLGFSTLHFAVRHGPDLVSILLDAKCEPGAANLQEVTPLHSAAGIGRSDVCELLLNAGARASHGTATGVTPAGMARRGLERCNPLGDERQHYEELAALLDAAVAREEADGVEKPDSASSGRARVGWLPAAPGHWDGLVLTGVGSSMLPPRTATTLLEA